MAPQTNSRPAAAQFRFPRKLRRRRRGSSLPIVTTCLFMLAGPAVAFMLWTHGWLDGLLGTPPLDVPQALAEVHSGVILLSMPNQDACRQRVFNNTTGQQQDDGVVDCKAAMSKVKQDDRLARMNAIGGGFRGSH